MDRELRVATNAAREAGAAIMGVFRSDSMKVEQKADDRGPITEADLASNAILTDALQSAFPEDGLLSEETADSAARLSRSRVWIIDPLDGTREFTLKLPEFVVSIGLVVDGAPRLGILYNPVLDEMISGVVGRGAWRNERAVHVSEHERVNGARILVSRNEMEKGWFDPWKGIAELTPMGSVAYKLGLVAAGRAEATFTPKPRNEWDLCGGVACVLAAGGRTSDGKGSPYLFNQADVLKVGVCGTNGLLHDTILGVMQRR